MHRSVHHADGHVDGDVVCGNCEGILSEWEGEDPNDGMDAEYLLLTVEKRWMFENRLRQPVCVMGDHRALGIDIFINNLNGGSVGYALKHDSNYFMEDFCSEQCAQEYLSQHPEFGLCIRKTASRGRRLTVQFVADAPDRFATEHAIVG